MSWIGVVSWIAGWINSSYPFELGGTTILAAGTVICALTLLHGEKIREALLENAGRGDGHDLTDPAPPLVDGLID